MPRVPSALAIKVLRRHGLLALQISFSGQVENVNMTHTRRRQQARLVMEGSLRQVVELSAGKHLQLETRHGHEDRLGHDSVVAVGGTNSEPACLRTLWVRLCTASFGRTTRPSR
eukprot:TRINITY_DN73179_c0_g1_i1.p1 TRINITY_DN73179_c0_g1~~TRINITY_DN73179_c0_g1_i1.p1  ORF type:complete len:114 (-),score=6.50 TRINITY_DN73179_c0_g1_i1:26-367(-)